MPDDLRRPIAKSEGSLDGVPDRTIFCDELCISGVAGWDVQEKHVLYRFLYGREM